MKPAEPGSKCYDCGKHTSETGIFKAGRRELVSRGLDATGKLQEVRKSINLCKDCGQGRGMWQDKTPAQPQQQVPQLPTRNDSFAAGHQKEVFYQPELGE
jgi:NMD protein affecting ribosome stability and mRNA decay